MESQFASCPQRLCSVRILVAFEAVLNPGKPKFQRFRGTVGNTIVVVVEPPQNKQMKLFTTLYEACRKQGRTYTCRSIYLQFHVPPPIRHFILPCFSDRTESDSSEQLEQQLVFRSHNSPVVLQLSDCPILPSLLVEQIMDLFPAGSREILSPMMSFNSYVLYHRDENLVFSGIPPCRLVRFCLLVGAKGQSPES
ncbi:unnamed protein product [Fraxinus pennsylvanica]|uniref:Uncharacterized protein n=1 Tax=Fraxinus pennsylvanica TaxID=56036 RepID=A0AAD2DWL2_9LAMI|nr:unnamed protein product [Fraxinus pennsylvanica]